MPEASMAQLDCHLRERWQRIERWREAHTPEVGNFYILDGELYLDCVPMPEGRELPDVIMYPPKPRSYWKNLGRVMPAFRGLPYDVYPRGRVVYLKAVAKYALYLGPELVADADSIQKISMAMHLPRNQTEVRLAEYYRTRNPWHGPECYLAAGSASAISPTAT
jgi:hypothetical protein